MKFDQVADFLYDVAEASTEQAPEHREQNCQAFKGRDAKLWHTET